MNSRNRKRQKRKLTPIGWALLFILIFLIVLMIYSFCSCLFSPDDNSEKKTTVKKAHPTTSQKAPVEPAEPTEPTPIFISENAEKLAISSDYGMLVCADDKKVIAEKNSESIIYPASMTKVMTLLVAYENANSLDDTFTFPAEIIDQLFRDEAKMAGFQAGETVTVKDMLYGTVLPSGADAATGLAITIAGSEEKFVELMNKKAQDLGLKNTHFVNTTGLHDPKHYSTCYDIAVIMEAAMNNNLCREVLCSVSYTTSPTAQNPEGLTFENSMFQKIYGNEAENVKILAGKTGFTNEAGCCLVSLAKDINNKEYILVTSKATNHWSSVYDAIYTYAKYLGTNKVYLPPENSGPTHFTYEGIETLNTDYSYFQN